MHKKAFVLVAAAALLFFINSAGARPATGVRAPRNAAFKASLSAERWQVRSPWRPLRSGSQPTAPQLRIHSLGKVVVVRSRVPKTHNGVAGVEQRDYVRLRPAGSATPNQVSAHQAHKKTLSLTAKSFALRKVSSTKLHNAAVQGVLSSTARNSRDAYRAAMTGLTVSLGDKYSGYFAPKVWEKKTARRNGTGQGLGISMNSTTGGVQILRVTPGSPAEGILVKGDKLVAVGGKAVRSTGDVQRAVSSKLGQPVNVTVRRGGRRQQLALQPAEFKERLVTSELAGRVGVVKLSRFAKGAAAGVRGALVELQRRAGGALGGVVLDLRGNGGGSTKEAHDLINLFVPRGELFSFKRHGDLLKSHSADPQKVLLPSTPLTVLVDGRSASSSEIVAGALKHRGRARLVGTKTFGKGIAQNIHNLPDGGGLKLTAMEITLGERGARYHGQGLQPDLRVEPGARGDPQLRAALGQLR
jgi:carboxyl-terminal processing protease